MKTSIYAALNFLNRSCVSHMRRMYRMFRQQASANELWCSFYRSTSRFSAYAICVFQHMSVYFKRLSVYFKRQMLILCEAKEIFYSEWGGISCAGSCAAGILIQNIMTCSLWHVRQAQGEMHDCSRARHYLKSCA